MANDNDIAKDADPAADLGPRLRRLLERYSQAELARIAQTSTANVSRYLSGTRVPADFCVALVERANVNPAWLLAGEGVPFLDQVRSDTVRTAGDLLELVQAMNAVQRLKLGSLAGKQQQKTLRELSEALASYEELRERTGRELRPMYQRLVDDFQQSLGTEDIERATALRNAAIQVSGLCDDNLLSLRLANSRCHLEHLLGNHGEALRLRRETFWRELAAHAGDAGERLRAVTSYVGTLLSGGYLAEARRVYRATLTLAEEDEGQQSYQLLRYFGSLVELASGNMREALPLAVDSYEHLDEAQREIYGAQLYDLMALSGALPLDQYLFLDADKGRKLSIWASTGHACTALLLACMCRDRATIQRAVQRHSPAAERAPETCIALFSGLVLSALTRPGGEHVERFDEAPNVAAARASRNPQDPFRVSVMRCHLLMASGRGAEAAHEAGHTQELIVAMPEGVQPRFLIYGYHLANVVRLTEPGNRPSKAPSRRTKGARTEPEQAAVPRLDREAAVRRLREFRDHGIVLFGQLLPSSGSGKVQGR